MANNSNSWIWWSLGGVAVLGLGLGSYFFIRKKRMDRENELRATSVPNPPSQSSSNSSTTITNPFKDENEVKAFQKWVNDVKNGNLVVDGKYGVKTNAEYIKYHQEYISAVASQNTPNLTQGFSKIKTQMLDKNVWGNNTKIDIDNSGRLRFSVDIDGATDAYVNFLPTGYFWIEIGNGQRKHNGTWTYANGVYSIKLSDNSYQGSDNEMSEMIKQLLKDKYPSEMKYYSFSDDKNDVDKLMKKSDKKYIDSQDSML